MNTRYPGDKKPCYQCNEFYSKAVADLTEPCGRIAAATLDELVTREVLRPWNQRPWNSACERLRTPSVTAIAFTASGVSDSIACGKKPARAERQYQLAEPENRLVVPRSKHVGKMR